MRTLPRIAGLVVLAIAGITVGILGTGWGLTRPVQDSVGEPPSDLDAKAISFLSAGNTTVHGWCPVKESRGSILLLPGIRANRLSMIERARFLRRAQFSVLLIDLRGTGETLSKHITFGWGESSDVIAAVDFLRRVNPQSRVGVIGSSLGGAAALLATPPLRIDGLVIEAVYPSVARATHNRLRKYTGALARGLAPLLLAQLQPRLGISEDVLRPIDHLQAVNCPILIIGGTTDFNTTVGDTHLMFEAAGSPKDLWMIENAGHVDFHRFARSEYERKVTEFFSRSLATP